MESSSQHHSLKHHLLMTFNLNLLTAFQTQLQFHSTAQSLQLATASQANQSTCSCNFILTSTTSFFVSNCTCNANLQIIFSVSKATTAQYQQLNKTHILHLCLQIQLRFTSPPYQQQARVATSFSWPYTPAQLQTYTYTGTTQMQEVKFIHTHTHIHIHYQVFFS